MKSDENEMRIIHDPHGYWTLYVNGKFIGNFDTPTEAAEEYDMFVVKGIKD